MTHPTMQIKEKVISLEGTTLEIWKVHPNVLRERDKNARYMHDKIFRCLVENMKSNKQLESLPFCYKTMSPVGTEEFTIISGHHRIRAARKAGFTSIYVLVTTQDLSKSQVIAKQIAHNSLAGQDDTQILKELYEEIDDINAKLESGLIDFESVLNIDSFTHDLGFDFEYEKVYILFLKKDYQNFEELLDTLDEEAKIYISAYEHFGRFKKLVKEVSKQNNVRNIAGIMVCMIDIIQKYLKQKNQEEKPS